MPARFLETRRLRHGFRDERLLELTALSERPACRAAAQAGEATLVSDLMGREKSYFRRVPTAEVEGGLDWPVCARAHVDRARRCCFRAVAESAEIGK
jgi:hypothetical protein